MISQRPEVFWGFIASMYIGNVMLLILNLPLVGIFVSVLRLPQHVLATLVLLLCLVGAFSLNNSYLDLWVLAIFGLFGLRPAQDAGRPVAARRRAGAGADDGEDATPGAVPHARAASSICVARPLTAAILIVTLAAFLGPFVVRLVRRGRAPAAAVPAGR